jgi:hypothetical protein
VLSAQSFGPWVWKYWDSTDPSRPCDGVSAVQSSTEATMTFDSLQHDAACEAHADVP